MSNTDGEDTESESGFDYLMRKAGEQVDNVIIKDLRKELASLREKLAKERGKSQRLNDDLANALDVIEKKEVENGELLKALEYGELELRTTYERFTNYKGSSSLWNMQNVLKKYKKNLSA